MAKVTYVATKDINGNKANEVLAKKGDVIATIESSVPINILIGGLTTGAVATEESVKAANAAKEAPKADAPAKK